MSFLTLDFLLKDMLFKNISNFAPPSTDMILPTNKSFRVQPPPKNFEPDFDFLLEKVLLLPESLRYFSGD